MDGEGYTPTVSSYLLEILLSISAIILILSALLALSAIFLCLRNWYYGNKLRVIFFQRSSPRCTFCISRLYSFFFFFLSEWLGSFGAKKTFYESYKQMIAFEERQKALEREDNAENVCRFEEEREEFIEEELV